MKTSHKWLDQPINFGYPTDEPTLRQLIANHYIRPLTVGETERYTKAYLLHLDDNPLVTALNTLLADVENFVGAMAVTHPLYDAVKQARDVLGIETKHTIQLTDEDREQAALWVPLAASIAEEQGWCMSDYDSTGALQLQKCDDQTIFRSDDEAIAYVMILAKTDQSARGYVARLALRLDRYFEPIIYGKDYVSKIHTFPLNYDGQPLRPDGASRHG